MLRSRIIPCLLVHKKGLVKTVNFKEPKYVGDPINAVKILYKYLSLKEKSPKAIPSFQIKLKLR